jgi:hypothetical protein
LIAHLLELRAGRFVAVLDGIGPGIDRCLYAGRVDGVNGDLEVLTVCLFDNGRELGNCEIRIGRHLDHIDVLEHILPDRLPRPIRAVDQ